MVQVRAWVRYQVDATNVAFVIFFISSVGLSNDEAYASAMTSAGGYRWTNRVNDEGYGCYSMLMGDSAIISGDRE